MTAVEVARVVIGGAILLIWWVWVLFGERER